MRLQEKLEFYKRLHLPFLYEDFNNPTATKDSILRKVAQPIGFPLSKEDKNDIIMFKYNYEEREHLGRIDRVFYSVAAPQLGISKRMILFQVPIGRGVVQPFPRAYWLNPTYEGIEEEVEEVITFEETPELEVKESMEDDYEMCLSSNMVGKVRRWRRIRYKATLASGKTVKGEAMGRMARIIQHEIDHLDGKLLVDHVPRDELITVEEYKRRRKEAWGGKSWMDMIEELKKEHQELKASYPPVPILKSTRRKKKKRKKPIV